MIFVLGRTPKLSAAELGAVLPSARLVTIGPHLISTAADIGDPAAVLAKLGGTVKIAIPVAARLTPEAVAADIAARRAGKERMLFGVSWFSSGNAAQHLALGLKIKKLLRTMGLASRLVTSRTEQLPAAAINRHGAVEYLVLPNGELARTVAAQDVDDFTHRDVGRPHRDLHSGTLPPKVARIMVNLARVPAGGTLLDPFCGSGTILTEAVLAGVSAVIGTDLSAKAVTESQANLRWLMQHYPHTATATWTVLPGDARELARIVSGQRIMAIVCEPYLGPPRRGRETRAALAAVIKELSGLYLAAFQQFAAVLQSDGRVVIVLPVFVFGREALRLPIIENILQLGFRLTGGPYEYSRPDQHVRRQITVWEYFARR